MATVEYSKGLEGVIAAESSICKIDGQNGELYYCGYPISELAKKASFEEVIYLLLYGSLPKAQEYSDFQARARRFRNIPPAILEMIRSYPSDSQPMDFLQSVISYLAAHKADDGAKNGAGNSSGSANNSAGSSNPDANQTLHIVIQLASVIAAYYRISQKLEYIPPKPELSLGANFLYMLRGSEPDEDEGEIMDACLVLHAEHHFNASTFTARVVASTHASSYSCISAAIGALSGNLHGGANERVMGMIRQVASPEKAEAWVNEKIANKQKVMGMGHRVYKVKDPRAVIMEEYLALLSAKKNDDCSYRILKIIEQVFAEYMKKNDKDIYPNVDFFSGAVYDLLGIPSTLFTPIFAASRISGWLAHILEQQRDNRLYRPTALYTGPDKRQVVAIENR